MSSAETKSILIQTGERLFAQHGFSAVSLRQIISASKVNLAAIHYHFGSKEALIQAILSRRIGPLNQERIDLLEAALQQSHPNPPPLDRLLEAVISPPLRLSRDTQRGGDIFMRLIGRAMSDPDPKIQEMLILQFKTLVERFFPEFQKVLPGLPQAELFWRLHFTAGAMIHTMTHGPHLRAMSGGLCDPRDTEALIQSLVIYGAAGLRAAQRATTS